MNKNKGLNRFNSNKGFYSAREKIMAMRERGNQAPRAKPSGHNRTSGRHKRKINKKRKNIGLNRLHNELKKKSPMNLRHVAPENKMKNMHTRSRINYEKKIIPNSITRENFKKVAEKIGEGVYKKNNRTGKYVHTGKYMGGSRKKTIKKTTKRKTTKRKTTKKTTRKPKVHKGPRGGKYIIRKGKKVYV